MDLGEFMADVSRVGSRGSDEDWSDTLVFWGSKIEEIIRIEVRRKL